MTWLFPLYLLGAGAILAPILMHLRRRPPQNRVEFSSLMFLEAQTPVPVSKRRLEHWLLLLLRCLVLLLLALMFARPLWRGAAENTTLSNAAKVILLDRSGSLQRGDLWKQTVAQAEKALTAAGMEDRIACATFDDGLQPLWTFDEDSQNAANRVAVIRQRLGETTASWGRTDLGRALVEAAGWFSSATGMSGRSKHIVLISDLQEGARLEALRGMVWPEDISVSVIRLETPNADNFSLALAAGAAEETAEKELPAGPVPAAAVSTVRVRLANGRESKKTDYTLAWEDPGAEPLRGYLPPGASRVLAAPPTVNNSKPSILRVSGDAWDFDNRIHVAPPQPKKARVAFLGEEKTRDEAASPLYYLSRALRPTAAIAPELTVAPANSPTLPAETNVAFASGSAPLKALRPFVEQGGLAILSADTPAAQANLRELTGAADLTLAERQAPSGYLMLSEVKTDHPLLRPFGDARLRDFTKVRFWKHRRLSLGPQAAARMEILAKFDNGDPAMVSCPLGQGTVLILLSGWHPADSQLALSTKFVPLLYGWLEAAGFAHEAAPSLLVGDALPAPAGATVKTPDRQTLTSSADGAVIAAMPGFYEVTPSKGAPTLFAVNLPPEESRLTPMEPEVLREWGVRLEGAAAGTAAAQERERLAVTEEEARQRAWLWILAGLLAILGAETFLAGRIKSRGEVLAPGA
jgi:hypothetical protein